jgi:hypothetical protein
MLTTSEIQAHLERLTYKPGWPGGWAGSSCTRCASFFAGTASRSTTRTPRTQSGTSHEGLCLMPLVGLIGVLLVIGGIYMTAIGIGGLALGISVLFVGVILLAISLGNDTYV